MFSGSFVYDCLRETLKLLYIISVPFTSYYQYRYFRKSLNCIFCIQLNRFNLRPLISMLELRMNSKTDFF